MMIDKRIRFTKTGEAKYISHLDLYRFMLRALKRAKLPVWHTEGFNPHVYVTFALPLSLKYFAMTTAIAVASRFRAVPPMV